MEQPKMSIDLPGSVYGHCTPKDYPVVAHINDRFAIVDVNGSYYVAEVVTNNGGYITWVETYSTAHNALKAIQRVCTIKKVIGYTNDDSWLTGENRNG